MSHFYDGYEKTVILNLIKDSIYASANAPEGGISGKFYAARWTRMFR
jgi:hypothetical protein